jgi:hypothetical protein
MMRPRGKPPTPSAMSSETEPEETAWTSLTSASSLPRRMMEPLPNSFSMDATASSIAFSFSGPTGIGLLRFLQRASRYQATLTTAADHLNGRILNRR